MSKTFDFIDLFAGIGGLRIPFDEIGGRCVLTSEIDKHAVSTYAKNFDEQEIDIRGDVTKIDSKDIPRHSLLLGGFPCQPFSHAGHKKGFDDTRGTLFFDVQRIIEAKKPKVVLLENVRGLVSHDGGNTFKRVLEILGEHYVVHHALLNARDFGLPQNRIRIFIVAIRKNVKGAADWVFPQPTHDRNALRVGDVLEKRVPPKYTISERLWESHQARKLRHEQNGNGFGFRLFSASSNYTSTLSARYYKDGAEILIEQKHKTPRKITPREAARLQGFPESFVINASDVQAYRQFGNAVPVSIVRAIAQSLKHLLN